MAMNMAGLFDVLGDVADVGSTVASTLGVAGQTATLGIAGGLLHGGVGGGLEAAPGAVLGEAGAAINAGKLASFVSGNQSFQGLLNIGGQAVTDLTNTQQAPPPPPPPPPLNLSAALRDPYARAIMEGKPLSAIFPKVPARTTMMTGASASASITLPEMALLVAVAGGIYYLVTKKKARA